MNYDDLDKYQYIIEANQIKIKDFAPSYTDEIQCINIAPSYTIDNKTYKVTEILDESFGALPFNDSILEEVIFPDTITKLGCNLLNFRDLKKIQLPRNLKTLDSNTFNDIEIKNPIIIYDTVELLKQMAILSRYISISISPNTIIESGSRIDTLYYRGYAPMNIESHISFKSLDSYMTANDLSIHGFSAAQINQIMRGYEKGLNLSCATPAYDVDILRTIVNTLSYEDEEYYEINKYFKQHPKCDLSDVLYINKILLDKQRLKNVDIENIDKEL